MERRKTLIVPIPDVELPIEIVRRRGRVMDYCYLRGWLFDEYMKLKGEGTEEIVRLVQDLVRLYRYSRTHYADIPAYLELEQAIEKFENAI